MILFVGCYSRKFNQELIGKGKGIYCFDFNVSSGLLKLLDVTIAINPSYLTISNDNKYLYAVEEIPMDESPKINAYKINTSGEGPVLSMFSEQELPGSYACHLSLSNSQTHLVVASYMSGNILLYPLGENGEILPLTQNIYHKGNGPNPVRQEAPHIHMIYPWSEKGIFVVDLGLDLAKAYLLDPSIGQLIASPESDINIHKGAGARHMVIHPDNNHAFIFSELTSQVFSYKIVSRKFELLEVISSLPVEYKNTQSGAAIRMHPDGQFLYVSNRGYDVITIFKFDKQSEQLSMIGYQPSGGKTPREINIDPTGQWLLVANQDSDNIVVFRIDQKNGLLKQISINNDIKTPSCIQFMVNDDF